MKKYIKLNSLLILSLIALSSCKNPLLTDPRIYNDSYKTNESITPIAPDIEIEDSSVTPFDDLNAWYNKPSNNSDEISTNNVSFPHTDFDTLALTSWFTTQNVPKYEVEKKDVWTKKEGATIPLYEYKGPNTKSKAKDKQSGFDVTNVYYYNSKGYNPLYSETTNNQLLKTKKGNPRLERFNFYSFKGLCMGQNLDNYLIAIDTYSKFIYAFAKPSGFTTVVGNQVPTGWEAVDDTNLFYEYDPVGYVSKTADEKYEIVIYKWFEDNLSQNNYIPIINPSLTSIAQKNPNGAGRSPFYVEEKIGASFKDNVKNKSYSFRESGSYTGNDGKGEGKTLYSVNFGPNGESLTISETLWGEETKVTSSATLISEINKSEASFKTDDNKNLNIKLSDDLSILTVNNTNYYLNFDKNIDLGPSFENRINKTDVFKVPLINQTYKFIDDNALFYESNFISKKKITYQFVENHDRSLQSAQAVYVDSEGLYWGVMLGSNGTKISMTEGVSAIQDIDWNNWKYSANK